MPENLTPLEAIALALGYSDQTESAVGDAIPQDVWTRLYERGHLKVTRDFTGEAVTIATLGGQAELLRYIGGSVHA